MKEGEVEGLCPGGGITDGEEGVRDCERRRLSRFLRVRIRAEALQVVRTIGVPTYVRPSSSYAIIECRMSSHDRALSHGLVLTACERVTSTGHE